MQACQLIRATDGGRHGSHQRQKRHKRLWNVFSVCVIPVLQMGHCGGSCAGARTATQAHRQRTERFGMCVWGVWVGGQARTCAAQPVHQTLWEHGRKMQLAGLAAQRKQSIV